MNNTMQGAASNIVSCWNPSMIATSSSTAEDARVANYVRDGAGKSSGRESL